MTSLTIRLSDDDMNELDELLAAHRQEWKRIGLQGTRSNVIRALIRQAHAREFGEPEA